MVRNIDIELKSGKKLSLSLEDVSELRECLRSLNENNGVINPMGHDWITYPYGPDVTCWGGNKPV